MEENVSNELKSLFAPIKINTMEVKNRAVMPAMATGYGNPDSTVSDRLIAYLARRAKGGTGLIITEVCAVDPRGKGFGAELGAWDDTFIPGLKRLTDAVHADGAKIALQLHHAGRETFEGVVGAKPEAPSPIPSPVLNQACEEMGIERIHTLVAAFASAAARAKKAGFDAVEIHGAHGYLLNQFLSPFSNARQDEYGGSDEKRARFLLEIVAAVRKSVGPDFTIIVRISGDEAIRKGFDLDFTKWLAPKLVEAGADAIHVSVGVYSTPGNLSIASMDTEEGFNLFRARAIKDTVKVPVIGVGRIHDPRLAEQAIARGDADLISFGRQHLTDPDFLGKARDGRHDDIRRCIACNQGCIERLMFEFKSATCVFNPDCGNEYKGDVKKAAETKKVWIVGAGPAGVSAAMYASMRGHAVELFESGTEPGGQLLSASMPPHKEGLKQWFAWALRQLESEGIKVQCGKQVTPEMINQGKPDFVVLAAGARPLIPAIAGIDGPSVVEARDVLLGKVKVSAPVAILGAGYVGMETADYLAAKGTPSVIIEMKQFPPVNAFTAHGYWLNKRIKESGGRIELNSTVQNIGKNSVVFRRADGSEQSEPAATVILALGARPNNDLESFLKENNIPYSAAGDVKVPRRFIEAIHEGARAGREI
jgi:2,4-dienoyl-CoA reductase-like NADH-dependent reductase (Old Yellow Enzyme family)/NADPH-dependent 2,4-dienoyl-CoA reductase/sulfur reductase-like enzyme